MTELHKIALCLEVGRVLGKDLQIHDTGFVMDVDKTGGFGGYRGWNPTRPNRAFMEVFFWYLKNGRDPGRLVDRHTDKDIPNEKFCVDVCRAVVDEHKNPRYKRTCAWCGDNFLTADANSKQRFCSAKCHSTYSRYYKHKTENN